MRIETDSSIRRFHLIREHDDTGVSGKGHVADGVLFDDGTCVMRWRTDVTSTVVYESIEDLIAIHGHGGKTRVRWVDFSMAFERGAINCYQDRCEGCPPLLCVAKGKAPDYVPDEKADDFVEGYAWAAEREFGAEWRTWAKRDGAN